PGGRQPAEDGLHERPVEGRRHPRLAGKQLSTGAGPVAVRASARSRPREPSGAGAARLAGPTGSTACTGSQSGPANVDAGAGVELLGWRAHCQATGATQTNMPGKLACTDGLVPSN